MRLSLCRSRAFLFRAIRADCSVPSPSFSSTARDKTVPMNALNNSMHTCDNSPYRSIYPTAQQNCADLSSTPSIRPKLCSRKHTTFTEKTAPISCAKTRQIHQRHGNSTYYCLNTVFTSASVHTMPRCRTCPCQVTYSPVCHRKRRPMSGSPLYSNAVLIIILIIALHISSTSLNAGSFQNPPIAFDYASWL